MGARGGGGDIEGGGYFWVWIQHESDERPQIVGARRGEEEERHTPPALPTHVDKCRYTRETLASLSNET